MSHTDAMRTAATVTALVTLSIGACKSDDTPKQAAPPRSGMIAIEVTEKGFEPETVSVERDKPVTLVFTRRTDQTCAKQVVLHVDEQQAIEKDLPLDQPVEIATTFPKSGSLTYACGMDMIKGHITVQ
jgi:plastocyanin domain-containing protein